jgi:outer membrane protein assembly factor BamA
LATTTGAGEINADLQGDFRFERPDRRVLLHAAALNADVIRYFGLGNETVRSTIAGFNNVTQRQYALEPTVLLGITGPLRFEVGGLLRWSETDDRFTLLSVDPPYGAGSFAEAAVNGALVYDSRNEEKVPTRGVTLALTGRAFPAALDVASGFGSVELVGTTYLTAAALPSAPTLALRAGAKRMFGTYPFFEAADIGGWESFRGFTTRRFTGDAAVYGNADLRLNLGSLGIGPKRWGVLGLADIGRVYLEGETSHRWHTAFGGGVWTMFSGHLVSATAASGGERLRFYVKSGFHF